MATNHPDHDRFIVEFWETCPQQAVHFARIAAEAGKGLFSLGTETDRLCRTRPWKDHLGDDFRGELHAMAVFNVYDGLVSHDQHWGVLRTPDVECRRGVSG